MTANRQVWKYPMPDRHEMPRGAKPLHVGIDPKGQSCVWVEVDTSAEIVARDLRVVGTGWEIPEGAAYVASWNEGPYMWHLYDMGEVPK